MPFPWGKSSLKSTSNQETKGNAAPGLQSWVRPTAKSLPSDLCASSGSKSNRIERTQNKLVSGSVSTSTLLSQASTFTEANKGHPLPLPYFLPALIRADSADSVLSHTTGAYANTESLFRLPSPNEVKLRSEARDGDVATSGYGSVSTSSYSSLSSTDMPDLHSGHRERNIFDLRLTSESEIEVSKRRNFNMLQGTCVSGGTGSSVQKISLPCRNHSIEKNVPTGSPKRPSGGGKSGLQSHEYQGNSSVCSTSNSLLSSPRLSPRRYYHLGQSCPSPPAATGNSETTIRGTVSMSRSQQSPQSLLSGDMMGVCPGQPGGTSQECSPLTSPRVQRNKTDLNSGAPSSLASPVHPAVGGFWLDSATSSLENSRTRHPLSMAPSRPSEQSPYTSPPIPSSPRSLQLHSLSRSENTVSCTSQWQKGKLLGSGTFGNVYKGFSNSGTFCAMKEVLISDDSRSKESVKQLSQEIQVLSQLRHPNIVQYMGSEFFEDRLLIYLEYISGGSIHKLLQEYGKFKENVIRNFTRQILRGLAYLHSMSTVHRDIKGANILVDTNGEVKLADFGMAKHINAHSMPLSFKGSPYWMAPEVFKSTNGYDYPVDIWSLGCTIIEMATAKPPWSQYEGIAALFKIGNSKEIPSIPESLSMVGQEFVNLCLRRDPSDRPSASELLEHPFTRVTADFAGGETNHGLDCMTSYGVTSYSSQSNGFEIGRPSLPQPPAMLSSTSEYMNPQMGHMSPMASPCSSPKLQQRTPYQTYGGFSPSPISSPLIGSGSSTPRSGANGNQSFIMMPMHSTTRSSFTENRGDVSRRPTSKAFENSPGRYIGLDPEASDHHWNIQTTYVSEHDPRNGMYRFA